MRILPLLWLLPGLMVPLKGQPKDLPDIQLIAFASCFKETRPAPALATLADLQPDVFVWMGDNVYGDTADMAEMKRKYDSVLEMEDYRKLADSAAVIGTWDDHDYGKNDAGKEFVAKAASQRAFLDFIGEAADSSRRRQEGVYGFHDFGPEGKQVRVILLDTRYHRDPIGSDGTILGETQWKWLEETLKASEAKVNVLVSSIQVLPSEHRFEKWSNFPKERARLLALLARQDIPPVLLLSGDRHLAEITVDCESCGYDLYEITSSSLNLPLGGKKDEANGLRVGRNYRPANFGTLSIDWSREVPVVTACIRDVSGQPQRAVSVELAR